MKDGGYIYSYSDIRYDGSLQMNNKNRLRNTWKRGLYDQNINYITSNLNLYNQNANDTEKDEENLGGATVTGGAEDNISNGTQSQTIASQFNVTGIDEICIPISQGIFSLIGSADLTIKVWFSLNNRKSNFAQFKIKLSQVKGYKKKIYIGNQEKDSSYTPSSKDQIYMIPLWFLFKNQVNLKDTISYQALKSSYGKSRGMSLSFTLGTNKKYIYYEDSLYGNGLNIEKIKNLQSYWNQYTKQISNSINSINNSKKITALIKNDPSHVKILATSINNELKKLAINGRAGHFAITRGTQPGFTAKQKPSRDLDQDFFYTMFTVTYIDISAQVSYNGLSKPVGGLSCSSSCRSTEDYFTFPSYFGSKGQAYNVTDDNTKPIITKDKEGDIPLNEKASGEPQGTYSLYLSGTLDADKLQRTCPKVLQAPSLPPLTKNTWSTNSNVVKTLVPLKLSKNTQLDNVLKAYNSASIILDNVVKYSKSNNLSHSKYYALISPILWTLTAVCVYDRYYTQSKKKEPFRNIITGSGRSLDFTKIPKPIVSKPTIPKRSPSYTREEAGAYNYIINIFNNDYAKSIQFDAKYCNPYGQQNIQQYPYPRNNTGTPGKSKPSTLTINNKSRSLSTILNQSIIFDYTTTNYLLDNTNHLFIYYNTTVNTKNSSYLSGSGPIFYDYSGDSPKSTDSLNIVNGYIDGSESNPIPPVSTNVSVSDIGSILSQWGGITVGDPYNTFQGQNTEGILVTGKGQARELANLWNKPLNYGASLLCMQYRQNDLSFNLNSEGPACFSYNDGFSADSSGCLCDRSFNIGLIGYSTFNPWIYLEGTIQINSIYSTGSDPALGLYSCSSQQPFALIGVSSMTYTFGSDAPELTATGSTVKNCLLQVGDDGIKLGADRLSVDNILVIQGNVGGNTINLGSYGDCNGQITTCNVRDVGIAYLNIGYSADDPVQPNYQAILASNNQNYGGLANTSTSTCSDCDANNFGCPYQSGCSSGIIAKGGNYIVKQRGGAVCTSSKTCKTGISDYDLKGYSIGKGQTQAVSNLTRAGGSIRGCFSGPKDNPTGSTISINNIIGINSIINVLLLSTYLSPYNSTGSFTAYSGVYLDNVRLKGANVLTLDEKGKVVVDAPFNWDGSKRGSFEDSTFAVPSNYIAFGFFGAWWAGVGLDKEPTAQFRTGTGPKVDGEAWDFPRVCEKTPCDDPDPELKDALKNRIIVGTTLQGGYPLSDKNIISAPLNDQTCSSPSKKEKEIGFYYQPTYSFPATVTGTKFKPIVVKDIYVGENEAPIKPLIKRVLIAYDLGRMPLKAQILGIDKSDEIAFKGSGDGKFPLEVFNPYPTNKSLIVAKSNSCSRLDSDFLGKPIVDEQGQAADGIENPKKIPATAKNYYNKVLAQLFNSTPKISIKEAPIK